MSAARQVLFIQGGSAGVHDDWDDKLVESLRHELGDGYEIRYPRMPDEDAPSYGPWSTAIRAEMAHLDDGAVVAGHSVGAAILINALSEQPPEPRLAAIVLIAAPFVGEGGWPGDEFELPSDLGAKVPQGVRVLVFHGLQDETAPISHADRYADTIPQAEVRRLPGRDHQLNNDLSEVAREIVETAARPSIAARYERSNDLVPIRLGATSTSIQSSKPAGPIHSRTAFTSMTSNSLIQKPGPKPSDDMKRVHESSKYVSQCALNTTPCPSTSA
jgi:pimeloyl-ACP methyl ester carboxylesterase